MYSRYSNRSEKPIRLPEHYSGCAFSEYRSEEAPTRAFGVAKPSPPPPKPPTVIQDTSTEEESFPLPIDPLAEPSFAQGTSIPINANVPEKKESTLPAMKHLLGGFGKGLSFSKGLDFDQLLILGLILLLSHTEQDSDIVWWLGLLLLCG